MRTLLVLSVVYLTAAASPAADAKERFEVEVVKDLAYNPAKDADADKHKLDLYLPKGKKGFPVLVFVHGGGYSKGDRKEGEGLGKVFAARGVGAAVISYRLFPAVKHPGHVQDVAKAFAWVKANAAKHGGDPRNVFVGGHSAGAHLAALLATDASYLKAEKLALSDVAGVVAISGGYRILPIRKDVFGDEAAMAAASPFSHLKGGHPPFLIVYGDGDTPERHELSKEFRDALKKAGGDAEVLEVKGRTHQELFTKIGDGDATTEAALAFVAKRAAKVAQQFVLFDATFTFTKEDADNSKPSKSHYYVTGKMLNADRPKDWTSPVDYRNGTVHIRAEVLEKPAGGAPTTWSLCYIPNKGRKAGYGCTGTDVYREKGVYEKDVAMTAFWQNDLIVWEEGIKEMHLVMKDDSGGSGHAHKRTDPEKFFPTKKRITMIQVAKGAKYDPKLVPNLPERK